MAHAARDNKTISLATPTLFSASSLDKIDCLDGRKKLQLIKYSSEYVLKTSARTLQENTEVPDRAHKDYY